MASTWNRTIERLLMIIARAKEEAHAEVPESIQAEHWQKAHGDPNAWEAMEFKYPGVLPIDAMATLVLVEAKLRGLLIRAEAKDRPPDLRLGKMRRYQ